MSENPFQAPPILIEKSGGEYASQGPEFEQAVLMLRQTKPWVRFISVLMFIGSAFMVLGGLVLVVGGAALAGREAALIGVVYVIMAFLYIVPAVYLWRYADRIARLTMEHSMGSLASALEAQKSFWRFVGICMLVMLCAYAMLMVFFMLLGVAGGLR